MRLTHCCRLINVSQSNPSDSRPDFLFTPSLDTSDTRMRLYSLSKLNHTVTLAKNLVTVLQRYINISSTNWITFWLLAKLPQKAAFFFFFFFCSVVFLNSRHVTSLVFGAFFQREGLISSLANSEATPCLVAASCYWLATDNILLRWRSTCLCLCLTLVFFLVTDHVHRGAIWTNEVI